MSVPVVAKFRRLLDSLPKETLPDVVASLIRASDKEKLQVRWLLRLQYVITDYLQKCVVDSAKKTVLLYIEG